MFMEYYFGGGNYILRKYCLNSAINILSQIQWRPVIFISMILIVLNVNWTLICINFLSVLIRLFKFTSARARLFYSSQRRMKEFEDGEKQSIIMN